jgi:lipid-binding SYLF domain-containing protein
MVAGDGAVTAELFVPGAGGDATVSDRKVGLDKPALAEESVDWTGTVIFAAGTEAGTVAGFSAGFETG